MTDWRDSQPHHFQPEHQTTMKQLATLAFYSKYAGWHTYAPSMKPQINSLVRKGFLEMNEFSQARFTGKTTA